MFSPIKYRKTLCPASHAQWKASFVKNLFFHILDGHSIDATFRAINFVISFKFTYSYEFSGVLIRLVRISAALGSKSLFWRLILFLTVICSSPWPRENNGRTNPFTYIITQNPVVISTIHELGSNYFLSRNDRPLGRRLKRIW